MKKGKTQNEKVAKFLTNNNDFRNKFMSMTQEEQMLAIRILKAIL